MFKLLFRRYLLTEVTQSQQKAVPQKYQNRRAFAMCGLGAAKQTPARRAAPAPICLAAPSPHVTNAPYFNF